MPRFRHFLIATALAFASSVGVNPLNSIRNE